MFAATDSVAVLGLLSPRSQPQLFSLVFGEGIVNDATSVVLLGALQRVARHRWVGRVGRVERGEGGGMGRWAWVFWVGSTVRGCGCAAARRWPVWRVAGGEGAGMRAVTGSGAVSGVERSNSALCRPPRPLP